SGRADWGWSHGSRLTRGAIDGPVARRPGRCTRRSQRTRSAMREVGISPRTRGPPRCLEHDPPGRSSGSSPAMPSRDTDATPTLALRGGTAADLVTVSSRSCSPFSTVLEATLVFRDQDCSVLPVLEAGRLLAVVTDRDLALGAPVYCVLAARPVSDVMCRDLVEVRPDDPLEAIERLFAHKKVQHLVVIDADGRLVGVIAWCDLIKHLTSLRAEDDAGYDLTFRRAE